MITENEFYRVYSEYGVLISKMREKLLEAIKRDKNRDYSEQWQSIETLENLQNLYHKMYHFIQITDSQSGKALLERKKLLDKITRLEIENESLKTNLNL